MAYDNSQTLFYNAFIENKNNMFDKFHSYISRFTQTGVTTRQREAFSATSCRFWQLFFMLMYNVNSRTNGRLLEAINYKEYSDYSVNEFKQLYDTINVLAETPGTYEYALLNQNASINGNIINVLNIQQLSGKENYCLCLYNPDPGQIYGSISHFFTIFINNGQYYLNSAYGGGTICVPQYTTLLDASEFNNFCVVVADLNNPEYFEYFTYFFNKYFAFKKPLKALYLSKETIDEEPALNLKFPQTLAVSTGINYEISRFKETHVSIGWIYNYNEDIILKNIERIDSGGKKYKRKTRKQKKSRKARKQKKSRKTRNIKKKKLYS